MQSTVRTQSQAGISSLVADEMSRSKSCVEDVERKNCGNDEGTDLLPCADVHDHLS